MMSCCNVSAFHLYRCTDNRASCDKNMYLHEQLVVRLGDITEVFHLGFKFFASLECVSVDNIERAFFTSRVSWTHLVYD